MTPENMAREARRLYDVVRAMHDGVSEHEPWDWLRFTDPMFYGFTVGENARYAHVRAGLPCNPDQWSVAPAGDADTKLADLFPDEQD